MNFSHRPKISPDEKHKLEIATLKRKLEEAERRLKKMEEIAHERKQLFVDIRDDVLHFCQEWLKCLSMCQNHWRARALASKLWFDFCLEVFPSSEEELLERIKRSRLFENGELPQIKKP